MSLFSLITSHLPLALPQTLSSTISSQPGPARHLPLVANNHASSLDSADWLSPVALCLKTLSLETEGHTFTWL